jgi:hypothetical protein
MVDSLRDVSDEKPSSRLSRGSGSLQCAERDD